MVAVRAGPTVDVRAVRHTKFVGHTFLGCRQIPALRTVIVYGDLVS